MNSMDDTAVVAGPASGRLRGLAAIGAVATAVSLSAISLVPPLVAGADTAATAALLGLHLVPAAVMIPALARSLRT